MSKVTLLLLVLLVCFVPHVQGQTRTTLSKESLGICDPIIAAATLCNAAALNAAITAAGSNACTMPLTAKNGAGSTCTSWNIDANVTIPATILLQVPFGVVANITSGKTFTINGPFSALPNQQVFSGSGTVVFGARSTPVLRPEWWGGKADGATISTTAIQSTLQAACGASTPQVMLAQGAYLIDAALTIPCDNLFVVGVGLSSIIRQSTASADGLVNVGIAASGARHAHITLRDFTLDCASNVQCGTGINLKDVRDSLFENMRVSTPNATTSGFLVGINVETTSANAGSYRNLFRDPYIQTFDNASAIGMRLTGVGVALDGATSLRVYGGSIEAAHGIGIWYNKGNNAIFSGIVLEGGTAQAIDVVGVTGIDLGVLIEGCRFENTLNNGAGILLESTSQAVTTIGNLLGSGAVVDQGTTNCVFETVSAGGAERRLACSGGAFQFILGLQAAQNLFWSNDTYFGRRGASQFRFGDANIHSVPTAQTLSVIDAGGGSSDLSGAPLTIIGSRAVGTGVPGPIKLQTSGLQAASGNTTNSAVDRLIVGATKVLTNNTPTAIVSATLVNGSVHASQYAYTVEVTDGTDYQVEEGLIACHVTNKAGSIANNTCVKSTNQQATTSGTLTVTFTISAANPALISVNANSSLTPSSGYPRITYQATNGGQQSLAIQ
jgi:hypothetical protein